MPEASQVHVNMALTNVSLAYRNPAFIADLVAPPVSVKKQQDKYFVIDPEREAFRSTPDHRAPGAAANEVDFELSSDSYYCEDHALTSIVPDEERGNADPAIQPDIDRTEFLADKIDLNKEIELANVVATDSALPGTTLSGTDQWDDASSTPLDAIEDGKAAIIAAAQVAPNTLVLPYDVYRKVRQHASIMEAFKYTNRGIPAADALADLFGVERILVPRALKNTANPGVVTPAMSYVWGKHAFLAYVPPRAGLKTVSFALSFAWTMAPGSMGGRLVESWRENARKGDMIRVQRYYDQKVIAPGAVYVWKSAVA